MKLPFISIYTPMSQLHSKHIAQRWAKAWRKALSPWPRHTTWGRLGRLSRLSCRCSIKGWSQSDQRAESQGAWRLYSDGFLRYPEEYGRILHICFFLLVNSQWYLLTSRLFGWKISWQGLLFFWGMFILRPVRVTTSPQQSDAKRKNRCILYTGVFCGWWGDEHPRTLTKFGVKTCRVSGWSDFELVRPIDCRLHDRPSPRRKWLMERSCMGVWSCILLRQANTSHFKRLFIPIPKAQAVSRSLKGQRGDCWCRKTPILQPRLPEHWQAVHHHEALSGQRGRRVDSRVQDELRRDQGMPGRKPQGFAEENGWEK